MGVIRNPLKPRLNGPLARKLRQELGLTLDELADKAGVSRSTVSDLENSKDSVGFRSRKKLEICLSDLKGKPIDLEIREEEAAPDSAKPPADVDLNWWIEDEPEEKLWLRLHKAVAQERQREAIQLVVVLVRRVSEGRRSSK